MSIPYGSTGIIRVEGFIGNEEELAEKILLFLKKEAKGRPFTITKPPPTQPKLPPPKPYKPLRGRELLPSEEK